MKQVVILDAGSQYGKLIDKRVRELNIHSDILPLDTPVKKLKDYQAIIISGGPDSVYADNAARCDSKLFDLNMPILGVCYGAQLMNYLSGGTVVKKPIREDGQMEIKVETNSLLFKNMNSTQMVLLTHGDSIEKLADNYKITAQSPNAISGIEHCSKKIYGVQFHPEVDLTVNGRQIFKNFLLNIAGLTPTFTLDTRLPTLISDLKAQIGNKHVLILVSGGVDSTVCLALLHKAIPKEQIHALHIDHGFMRLNESDEVNETFKKYGFDVKVIRSNFLDTKTEIDGRITDILRYTIKPEEKRKIIGDTFMRVADAYLKEIGLTEFYLVQGTLRPDLIESASKLASGKADTIKTHHNDTNLVRQKRALGLIIEPLKDYHKNEVRELGKQLGLAEELVIRQPFAGPGLAIRILCTRHPYLNSFDEINEQLNEFCGDGINATLLPIRSVGIQGDCRTFGYTCAVSGKLDWKKLFELARLIPQKIHKINRVVYVMNKVIDKPIKQITTTFLNEDSLNQLRLADSKINKILAGYNNGELIKTISQMPIVLIPVPLEAEGNRSIVLRPIITSDFMTGSVPIPGEGIQIEILNQMVHNILEDTTISSVMYDLTSKPPGTIEWE